MRAVVIALPAVCLLQVQGLMEVFDRSWCNLYVWTPAGGSGLYHIQ